MEVDTRITVIAMGMQPQFIPLLSVVLQNPDIYLGIPKHVQQLWLQLIGKYFNQSEKDFHNFSALARARFIFMQFQIIICKYNDWLLRLKWAQLGSKLAKNGFN